MFCQRDATALAADAAEQSGVVGMLLAGRYRLLRKLGDGGMGSVYEAVHERIGRHFAVKILHREFSRNPEIIERFQREARATAAIGNEHIVEVVDFDVAPNGSFFLAMEYLEGEELRRRLARTGRLPLMVAVDYALQIANALEAAHRLDIVHRDLKPENVFVVRRPDGREILKVLDFGISKIRSESTRLTRTGAIMGTTYYMSPEQARGDGDIDARADVWALGAMVYEMLAGAVPFPAVEATGVLMKILLEEPVPLRQLRTDISPAVESVIMRALCKDRAHRFDSCTEFGRELTNAAGIENPALAVTTLAGLGPAAVPPLSRSSSPAVGLTTPSNPVSKPSIAQATGLAWQRSETGLSLLGRKRGRQFAWGAGIAVALLAAAIGGLVAFRPRAPREAPVQATVASPSPAPAEITVALRSAPAGARVQLEETVICTTPCAWRTVPSERRVTLHFSKEGYIDAVRDVSPSHNQSIDVSLAPVVEREPLAKPTSAQKKTSPKERKPSRPRRAAPNPFEDP